MMSSLESVPSSLYAVTNRSSILALAKLRSYQQIEVTEYQGKIWFKLPSKFNKQTVPYLPCTYYKEVTGGMANVDSSVPVMGFLPENLLWMPIQQWWKLHVQSNALQQYVLDQTSLQLICSTRVVEPAAMLVDIEPALEFVKEASVLRTKGLLMAINQQKECWIEGALLPSIKAKYFEISANVATPLGKTWSPRVDASAVHSSLGASPEDRVVFHDVGMVDVIPAETLVPLTAANLNASWEAFEHND